MGRWFPSLRKGSREQVAAFDKAQREQNQNAEREYAAGVREETGRYHELNHRTSEAMRPLSPLQRSMLAHDVRETRAGLRERRAQRKATRARRAR